MSQIALRDRSARRRVAVIGGSSSIGRHVVSAFCSSGCSVLSTYRNNARHDQMEGETQVALDLATRSSIEGFAQDVPSHLGEVDVLVLLAGILPGKSLKDYGDDEIHRVMDVNFTAQAILVRHLLPHLADGALTVMVTSISGERGSYDPIYAASKAAGAAFTRSMASWMAPKVRFIALAPSLIADSAMYHDMAPERRTYHQQRSANKELVSAQDLAAIIVDLASPHWRHLNGGVIRITGGGIDG